MPTLVLTEKAVSGARPLPGGRLELWDLRTPGLCLRVTSRGIKTWIFRYRTPDGRQPRYSIGSPPGIGLKDARERAAELGREVSLGGDPAAARRETRVEVKTPPQTFTDLASTYFAACETGEWKPKGKRKKASVIEGEKARVRRHVEPILGDLPVGAIGRPHVKALLKAMTEKGIGAQTNLTQAIIRQIFSFAISDDLVLLNPATGFPRYAETKPRSRIWRDPELVALWAGLDDPSRLADAEGKPIYIGEPMRIAIKLLTMLGQRRGEVIGMEKAELDLPARTWLIDGKRTKGSRSHMVPLPEAAVPLIERAIFLSDQNRKEPSPFVFPSPKTAHEAVHPASVTYAVTRLKAGLGLKGPTVHDLRRTVSTNMTSERCGVTPFIRSKVLGHLDAGGGAQVSSIHYDANSYIAEKRRALETWASLLATIVGEDKDARPSVLPAGASAS